MPNEYRDVWGAPRLTEYTSLEEQLRSILDDWFRFENELSKSSKQTNQQSDDTLEFNTSELDDFINEFSGK